MGPLLSPQVLVGEEGVTNSVVHLHELSGFPGLDQILWELLHGARNSVEQVSGPGDGSGNSWQVPHNLWVALELLVLLLNSVDLGSVLSEQDSVLGVQAILQVVSMEDRFELSEKLEGVFNGGDLLEVLVNVVLELDLNLGHINVEFDEISVEGVLVVVKKFVLLVLELLHIGVEGGDDWGDVLQVVLLESLELLNCSKQLNQLVNSSAEQVKLSEDLVGGKLELLSLWHVHESLLGELVLLDVGVVQVNAGLEDWDEFFWGVFVVVPELNVGGLLVLLDGDVQLLVSEFKNVLLAVGDHGICDLDEQTGHSLVGVVVSSNGVDHLDRVHQGWEGVLDSLWGSIVEWLDELLKSLKVLNVILSLVKSFSDLEDDVLPLVNGKIYLILGLSLGLIVWLGGGVKNIEDSGAVLASELFGDASQLSHSLLPVKQLLHWTGVLLVLHLRLGSLEGLLDLFVPAVKEFLKLVNHLGVDGSRVVDSLDFGVPSSVVLIQLDVVSKTLESVFEFLGELVEHLVELLLLLVITGAPLDLLEVVDQGLVDLVDDGVQRCNGVLRDLSIENLVVVSSLSADWLVGVNASSKEVDSLSKKLFSGSIGDEEILTSALVNNISRIRDLVVSLVVNEYSVWTSSLKEGVKDWCMLWVSENFLCIKFTNLEYICDDSAQILEPRYHSHI